METFIYEHVIDPLLGWLKTFFEGFLTKLMLGLWNMVTRILGGIGGALVSGFNKVIDGVYDGFLGVFDFFVSIWQFVCDFWAVLLSFWDFIKFLKDVWNWVHSFITDTYNFFESLVKWLMGQDDGFGLWLWETIQKGLIWLGDFLRGLWERSQNFIFENGQWLYEWLLSNVDNALAYFINLIGSIFTLLDIEVNLPAGAMGAVTKFIEWGMFFDQFFPIKEMFQLLGIYLIFVVMMSLVRFVRSLIPFGH